MDKFTPLTPNGLITALILTLLTFWAYYVFFYPVIVQKYEQSFIQPVFFKTEGLFVKVRYPKYIADFVEREIVLEVENLTEEPLPLTIIVSGTITSQVAGDPNQTPLVHIAASGNGLESNTATSSALLLNLPPNGSAGGELLISIQNTDVITHGPPLSAVLTFYVSITDTVSQLYPDPPSITTLATTFSREKAFRQSAIRNLILPPWSNGILPALVLGAVWISESQPWLLWLLRFALSLIQFTLQPVAGFWRRIGLSNPLRFIQDLFSRFTIWLNKERENELSITLRNSSWGWLKLVELWLSAALILGYVWWSASLILLGNAIFSSLFELVWEFALIGFDSDIWRSGDMPDLSVAVIRDFLNRLFVEVEVILWALVFVFLVLSLARGRREDRSQETQSDPQLALYSRLEFAINGFRMTNEHLKSIADKLDSLNAEAHHYASATQSLQIPLRQAGKRLRFLADCLGSLSEQTGKYLEQDRTGLSALEGALEKMTQKLQMTAGESNRLLSDIAQRLTRHDDRQMSEIITCVNCGRVQDSTNRYCPQCGRDLRTGDES